MILQFWYNPMCMPEEISLKQQHTIKKKCMAYLHSLCKYPTKQWKNNKSMWEFSNLFAVQNSIFAALTNCWFHYPVNCYWISYSGSLPTICLFVYNSICHILLDFSFVQRALFIGFDIKVADLHIFHCIAYGAYHSSE